MSLHLSIMVKAILLTFIKDRVLLISFYVLNIICMIAFFHLSEPLLTEWFYPLAIGLFLLAVYLLIDWVRYYQLNRGIRLMLSNQAVELEPYTEEQKAFQQLLHKTITEQSAHYYDMKQQNEARLYFLSHWIHDLKTPVSVIELIINNGKNTDETADVYDKILQENRRLHASIEQGLTMLRVEKMENDLEIKAVDLLESLRKLINRRKREFIYQSIFPAIEWQDDTAYVVTDTKWNELLLDQIISNAIKYSSKKTGSKKLIFRIEREQQYISLSVIDEGCGIPRYDLERVFEPFFTGENGRRFSNSSGIGLYLCKRIADKVGQTITIDSTVGEGTTVMVRWIAGAETETI